MKRTLVLVTMLALSGCTTTQMDTAQRYQDALAGACQIAMEFIPLSGPVAPWIVGGCSTEAAIAKLALDPSSLPWLRGLIKQGEQHGLS